MLYGAANARMYYQTPRVVVVLLRTVCTLGLSQWGARSSECRVGETTVGEGLKMCEVSEPKIAAQKVLLSAHAVGTNRDLTGCRPPSGSLGCSATLTSTGPSPRPYTRLELKRPSPQRQPCPRLGLPGPHRR